MVEDAGGRHQSTKFKWHHSVVLRFVCQSSGCKWVAESKRRTDMVTAQLPQCCSDNPAPFNLPLRIKMSWSAADIKVCMMSQPCFRAVSMTVRSMQKFSVPSSVRKFPETFSRTFRHSQIPFRLVIRERHSKVVMKSPVSSLKCDTRP